ncbi:sialidase family protein [Roseomonas sp. WA12]
MTDYEWPEANTFSEPPVLADRPLNNTPRGGGTESPLLSADTHYGTYVSQQIQSIARVGQRMWRANYGQNHLSVGVGGEGHGCFVRLQYSDLLSDGTLGPWVYAFACVPRAGTKVGVLDPHVCAMPDGRLLITMPTSGAGGRAAWACVLDNPLADRGWKVGPFCFLGIGFVGRPRIIDYRVYITVNEPVNGLKPVAPWQGARVYRLRFDGEMVLPEYISIIPPFEPRMGTTTFQETSILPLGRRGFMAFFRTKTGQFISKDERGDGNWSDPDRLPFRTISSRYDAARSPSGRIVYAGNGPKARGRNDMSVRLSEDETRTWPERKAKVFFASASSYASVEFGADLRGQYNGLLYVAFDHGRGTTRNPKDREQFLNALPIAVIREEDLAAGKGEVLQLEGMAA